MTTPKDNALHLMEGQGGLSKKDLNKLLNDFARACAFGDDSIARMAASKAIHEYLDAAFSAKTAHAHWVDQVEASGEAEKHAYPEGFDASCGIPAQFMCAANMTCASLTGNRVWDVKCVASALHFASRDPQFAIPPSTDLATLQRELALAYAGLERERGITKELAAALQGLLDFHMKPAGVDVATILDKAKFADVLAGIDKDSEALIEDARAALSKVQHVAARGAEVSE